MNLNTSIKDLGLSTRATRIIVGAKIQTFGELVSYSSGDLMKFRGFGRSTIKEVDNLVKSHNHSLGEPTIEELYSSYKKIEAQLRKRLQEAINLL